jgi:hypothetical protein
MNDLAFVRTDSNWCGQSTRTDFLPDDEKYPCTPLHYYAQEVIEIILN